MKKAIKTLVILGTVAAVAAVGVFGYSQYARRRPAKVVSAENWLMQYAPNQTYMGGSVVSEESMIVYAEAERPVLEILARQGQSIHVGDPVLRFDSTKDELTLSEKLLERQKLYDSLQLQYKEYQRYAYTPYERGIPTATPTAAIAALARGMEVKRLAAHLGSMSNLGGSGTVSDPYAYSLDGQPIPQTLIASLQQAAQGHSPIYARFEGSFGTVYLTAETDGSTHFAVSTLSSGHSGTASLSDTSREGRGTLQEPYTFAYTPGQEVTASFLSRYAQEARLAGSYIHVQLLAPYLRVDVTFTTEGSYLIYPAYVEPTPTPSFTPTPTPTPSPTPTPTPTATPEGWEDEPIVTPPRGGGMSRAEREAYLKELSADIRDNEVKYRQLSLDIQKLQTLSGGMVYSTVEGTVSLVDGEAANGQPLVEIKGGSGLAVTCMIGEMDLGTYPVGTQLSGFSYEAGEQISATVRYVSPMPITDSYSNGGNPNSSGYLMQLTVEEGVQLPIGSYVEFTGRDTLTGTGQVYLFEAFVREIEGQDYIFVVEDGVLRQKPVHTGRRVYEYRELFGVTLTPEDYIAFPYGKNVRDGAPIEITEDIW
ncbi:MAG: hypothetical protein IJR17_03700 [Clostridia bacterium]|nr:hypothetical protein [Clostridia bacterium]